MVGGGWAEEGGRWEGAAGGWRRTIGKFLCASSISKARLAISLLCSVSAAEAELPPAVVEPLRP